MKTPDCVELKNRIQAEIMKKYADVPKAEWARRQAEELEESVQPIAEFWRRNQPATSKPGEHVAETASDYSAAPDAEKGKSI